MQQILDWAPIVWSLRIAITIVLITVFALLLLLLVVRAARSARAHTSDDEGTAITAAAATARQARLDALTGQADVLEAGIQHVIAAQSSGKDWPAIEASLRARREFYESLYAQAEGAERGEVMPPTVPPNDELTDVDGFLIWKGRPVWWSGQSSALVSQRGADLTR
jgi:hypothetical protein